MASFSLQMSSIVSSIPKLISAPANGFKNFRRRGKAFAGNDMSGLVVWALVTSEWRGSRNCCEKGIGWMRSPRARMSRRRVDAMLSNQSAEILAHRRVGTYLYHRTKSIFVMMPGVFHEN